MANKLDDNMALYEEAMGITLSERERLIFGTAYAYGIMDAQAAAKAPANKDRPS